MSESKQRFEMVEGGSSKFWEIWIVESSVHVQYGRIGTTGQSNVKDESTREAALALQDKLIREKTKKGYAPVGASNGSVEGVTTIDAQVAGANTTEMESAEADHPPTKPLAAPANKTKAASKPKAADSMAFQGEFSSLTGAKVQSLAKKLLECRQDYEGKRVLDKNLKFEDQASFLWHAIKLGLMPPTHPAIFQWHAIKCSRLSVDQEAIFAMIPLLAYDYDVSSSPEKRFQARFWEQPILPSWSIYAHTIVSRALELDSERVVALLNSASRELGRGIQFARAMAGMEIPQEDKDEILLGLAEVEGTLGCASLSSGKETSAIAMQLGTDEEWIAALRPVILRKQFSNLRGATPVLARMNLDEMIEFLCGKVHALDAALPGYVCPLLASSHGEVEKMIALRNDEPLLFVERIRKLDRNEYPQSIVREELLVHGLKRLKSQGTAFPVGSLDEVSSFWQAQLQS